MKNPANVKNGGRTLVMDIYLPNIRDCMLVRNYINIKCVERPLVPFHILFSITTFTLLRSPMNIRKDL